LTDRGTEPPLLFQGGDTGVVGQNDDKGDNRLIKSMHLNNRKNLKKRRKQLRNNATLAEKILWNRLRNQQLKGRKFRRQHSFGNYILDFYCPSEQLAIEVDGKGHDTMDYSEYDQKRTKCLNRCGIKVLRFTNREIVEHIEYVLGKIGNEFG